MSSLGHSLRRLATRLLRSGSRSEAAPTTCPEKSGFHDLTVVSLGWITRRDYLHLAQLDAARVDEARRLLQSHSEDFRASLEGLWQVELRWHRVAAKTATYGILVDHQLASLNLLWGSSDPEALAAAAQHFCSAVNSRLRREFSLPDGLDHPPLSVTMRWPVSTAVTHEVDLEETRLALAAAFLCDPGA